MTSATATLTASPWGTFIAMLARDLRVLRRNFLSAFIRVILQPLLFVFVFAYVIPKTGGEGFSGAGGSSFSTILVPGLVAMAIVLQAMFGIIFPLVMELSVQRSIEDRVLAPISVRLLAVEKVTAGAIQALIGGLLVFPAALFIHAAGQAPTVHVADWPLFLLVLVAGSVASSAGSLALGTAVKPEQLQIIFALVLLPMTMLGCVYYPWAALHGIRWLQVLVLINPMVYVSEGLRATLTPQLPHMPTGVVAAVLVVGAVALAWLATRSFARRVIG